MTAGIASLFDKLNLRPQERRLVVGTAAVFFVVLNIWFIWPHFDDWKRLLIQREDAQKTFREYRAEVDKIPVYEKRLKQLESAGTEVPTEEQALQLQRVIQNQSQVTGFNYTSIDATPKARSVSTNAFFDEHTVTIRISTGNKELVNFLVNIANDPSMIRVRDMDLRPDNPQNPTRIVGSITFVASYQKKVTAQKPAAPAVRRKS